MKKGLITTKEPIDVFYRDGEKYPENFINGYLINKSNNIKYFNLAASYDAKINLETGEAYLIYFEEYNNIDLPTINELLKEGVLIDNNYLVLD